MNEFGSFYNNKNVLITGGAGFIGSHIATALHGLNARITILDNLSAGSLENLAGLHNKITFIKGDITDKATCLSATKNIDTVFHCAAFISVPDSFTHPHTCYTTNIEGTRILLEACKENAVKNFVFSSSAAVYGNKNTVCKETDAPNPQSPYAESKLKGEQLCALYGSQGAMSIASLRYFNVFGERQNETSQYAAAIAQFTHCMKYERPITIFGNGKQTRDFVSVKAVAHANLLAGSVPNIKGEVFNIASGSSITLFELIRTLRSTIKPRRLSIQFKPARKGDILHSKADCSKFRNFALRTSNFSLK
jgi:nucleoside-diphosphate-sugar epimerase